MDNVKIIIGLGNPGRQYKNTPHNVGFAVVDQLADTLSCALHRSFRFRSLMGRAYFHNEKLLLVRPKTYMNNSGIAVASILRYQNAVSRDIIVILDDADLDIGRLRIRTSGGSGGHKGLDSVIREIQTDEFTRVRIGIGGNKRGENLIKYVLTPFPASEQQQINNMIDLSAQSVFCIIESGTEAAMNKFNEKQGEKY